MINTSISFRNVDTISVETRGDHAFLYLTDKNGEVDIVIVNGVEGEKLKVILDGKS